MLIALFDIAGLAHHHHLKQQVPANQVVWYKLTR